MVTVIRINCRKRHARPNQTPSQTIGHTNLRIGNHHRKNPRPHRSKIGNHHRSRRNDANISTVSSCRPVECKTKQKEKERRSPYKTVHRPGTGSYKERDVGAGAEVYRKNC
ncbi:hypothetical protein QVD17_35271 [Tagetes erecta]|uniref:Uncharacterized protein n=1 Tax=Tagetes erecta TaxID=13708 RepID=A0AAD8JZL8_TARER|nr:hypothetical protein QVD17_35271 [Tagetes erecta]